MAVGVYPGSFNPPTIAHLAIAEAALTQGGLDRVELVVSEVALGKGVLHRPPLAARLAVLEAVAADRPWLAVRLTRAQLLADIAEGYDAVIVGLDKWRQILEPSWYGGSKAARDQALARLPRVLLAPRATAQAADGPEGAGPGPAGVDGPAGGPGGPDGGDTAETTAPVAHHPFLVTQPTLLEVRAELLEVSSSAVRAGRAEWIAPEAAPYRHHWSAEGSD